MSGALVPVRRTRSRKPPVQVGKIVPLHVPKETTEDIVRDVRERTREVEKAITAKLQALVVAVEARHRERVQDCIPLGMAMDRTLLDDWITIGERLLQQQGRNRR